MDKSGNNIREFRKSLLLTQAEFASKLKIGISTVAMWESGKRSPSITMLKRIADTFGVRYQELLNVFELTDSSAVRTTSICWEITIGEVVINVTAPEGLSPIIKIKGENRHE